MVYLDGDRDAATGVTEISAPEAPLVTMLPSVWSAFAVRSRSFVLLTLALLPISATVVFTATFMPTEAPTPTAAGSVALAGLTLAPAVTLLSEVFRRFDDDIAAIGSLTEAIGAAEGSCRPRCWRRWY